MGGWLFICVYMYGPPIAILKISLMRLGLLPRLSRFITKKKYTISQLKLISIYFKYTLSGRNTVSAIKNNFTLIHKNSV